MSPTWLSFFGSGFVVRSVRDMSCIMPHRGEALDRLAGEIEPTLLAVLSDINMLGMDGLELLGEIKQLRPDLPVMMVTAYGDDERRRQAAQHGAADFFTKPVDFEHLKAQLGQLPSAPETPAPIE
jgi:CheY-like chemotaxis protein